VTGHDYRSVAARIRQELPELDRVARRASRAWASASRDPEDLYVDAAALNVHGFYAGMERIFTLVAERIDASLPKPDLFPMLDRYRGFRHVVRNVYAYALDPRLVAVLVEDLPEANERLRVQLATFADVLEAIAAAADD